MKEFNSSGELVIQDENINSPGSPVNRRYVDENINATFSSRSPRVLVYTGTGTPDLSAFPDARVGDVIRRMSDGQEWRVDA